ncbi:MAG: hypothetical protein HY924_13415 [Elusimicrobia bacterium]|nr:hypothetical protein [Elusimicrobiota bacterium]
MRISYSEDKREITIAGNRAGLEFLASQCLSLIEKRGPGGHIHLESIMYNLSAGSTSTILEYDSDLKNLIPFVATGKKVHG